MLTYGCLQHSVTQRRVLHAGRPTLLTRAIMAKMAESVMAVVGIPAAASCLACSCPPYRGAPSATTTCMQDPALNALGALQALRHPPVQTCHVVGKLP